MIIGNGSLANMLNDRDGFIFFASGISNSQSECPYEDRERETNLIGENIGYARAHGMMFVYFSSISIFTNKTRYTKHKFETEVIVKLLAENYCIIRLGNIYGDTNQNTFINKMQYWKRQGKLLDSMIRDEYKYMISKEQLLFITDNLPVKGKHEISVFGDMKLVKDLI